MGEVIRGVLGVDGVGGVAGEARENGSVHGGVKNGEIASRNESKEFGNEDMGCSSGNIGERFEEDDELSAWVDFKGWGDASRGADDLL